MESFDRERFDDVISGRHEDFSFEFYEAVLSEGSGATRSEVFRGVVVAFGTITRFPGLLVAAHRTDKASVGFLRGLFGDRLEELKSGVAALDEIYEFRSDNPDAARPLVTGKLARALEWLGETWPESPVRLALREGDGFLLIPLARNLFELPADGEPIDYTAHVEPMIADLAALLATAALVRKAGSADPKTE
ncbi:hypothetical protein [Mesorhizobium marinum]|uniref:hypothetical protein n=1 Tax=Mesorhizobium marinum TaxID=3228790 RepID=UPI00346743E6